MIYDYLIIGGGISGYVSAYELGKQNKTCLILEKNKNQSEKVCGGGVSYKALKLLEEAGMCTSELYNLDCKEIKGHIIHKNGTIFSKTYSEQKHSLGIRRKLFDNFLLENAKKYDVEIRYNQKVKNIEMVDGYYKINDYYSKEYLWAIGAKTPDGCIPAGQSIGISAQILTDCKLDDDKFYYWYGSDNSEEYFWAFPIGESLWNVGVWTRCYKIGLKRYFEECLRKYFICHTTKPITYLQLPKAEFLGHEDQRGKKLFTVNGVGDFAGKCNPINGGGIIYAIDSAIKYCHAL